MLVRFMELAMERGGVMSTEGFFAAVVACGLIYQDWDSIERHQIDLGGRPIPLLSQVLQMMRKVTTALIPAADLPPPPEHGHADRDPPSDPGSREGGP